MIVVQCRNETMKINAITKKILSIALLMLLAIGVAADDDIDPDADVNVTINAPPYVSEDTFEVTIDVTEVSDMNGGQFDLIYDPDVLTVLSVEAGNIDDAEIPITSWRNFKDDDYDRYRVIFRLDGDDCASGCGYLAKIIFEVVGGTGDVSVIDIAENTDRFKRKLSDCIGAQKATGLTGEISANWFGTNVTIGTAPAASDEAPPPTKSTTIVAASAPTPTATSIETPLFESESGPSASTARAQGAMAAVAASDDAPPENGGLQDVLTTHNFISIYSFVGLLAFIYSLTLFK
jgi:hypothetical protein